MLESQLGTHPAQPLAGMALSFILKSPMAGFGVMSGSFELYSLAGLDCAERQD
jgi:hypothetical protein